MALDTLASLADVPDEFEGKCDGVDALCYHLSACQCTKAIIALQKVLERFKHVSQRPTQDRGSKHYS